MKKKTLYIIIAIILIGGIIYFLSPSYDRMKWEQKNN